MTRLAQLIATEEGFFKSGSLPNRNNNPGDLRHSPHSQHTHDNPDGIGVIATVADGWQDLERQLQLDAQRGLTLAKFVETYAPPTENNTQSYLDFLCHGLNLPSTATVKEALAVRQYGDPDVNTNPTA